jgi:hypothetical protein
VGELQEEGILPAKLLVRTKRYLNNIIEIVFTQMTKPGLLTAGMGREDIANFDLAIRYQHPINHQLH